MNVNISPLVTALMPGLARSVQERELLIKTMDELCIIIHITSPIERSDGKQSEDNKHKPEVLFLSSCNINV